MLLREFSRAAKLLKELHRRGARGCAKGCSVFTGTGFVAAARGQGLGLLDHGAHSAGMPWCGQACGRATGQGNQWG